MKSRVPDSAEVLEIMLKHARDTAKPRLGSLLHAAIVHEKWSRKVLNLLRKEGYPSVPIERVAARVQRDHSLAHR